MLTEKDYCDYETCVALYNMGFVPHPYDNTEIDKALAIISLYEAQKWLREEKGIHISIDYDEFEWSYCLFDCSKKHYKQLSNCRMYFKSYEEVLLDGIKVSVDFLKEK